MSDELARIFASGGPFARALPRWQPREGQVRMAESVAACLRDGGVSLVEAGTGTGKTLAYLVPAVLSGLRVIVSTGTHTLQEQLLRKDIPLLREALGIPFEAALLKGRANYLCLRRLGLAGEEPRTRRASDARHHATIRAWADRTHTGDRAEVPGLPDDFPAWRLLSATSEQCLGPACADYEPCFVFRARRAAMAADLLVVNHHLFFADLALRARGFGEVFPPADAVIFDEAHQIEQVAPLYLGRTVSSGKLHDLVTDVERESARLYRRAGPPEALRAALDAAKGKTDAFFERFRGREGRARIRPGSIPSDALETARGVLLRLAEAIEAQALDHPDEALRSCAERTRLLADDLVAVAQEDDPDRVAWSEARGDQVALTSAPVELARTFGETIFADCRSVIFTSATLSSGPARGSARDGVPADGFAFVRRRLGVPPEAPALAVESPFDFARQALLYLPRLGVTPDAREFPARVAEEIARIVDASRGRAFALFTTHRNLAAAASRLRDRIAWPVLVQGEGSRTALLETFRDLGNAVLLATASFWEGVDVPGPALSCVIVDKLPFAPPDDPLEEARIARILEEGGNAFMEYQLPRAILMLRQGLGRLIRNEHDTGVLALLDERVQHKSYGRRVLGSLPDCPRTSELRDVIRFFGQPGPSAPPDPSPGPPLPV